jgi:hypothetical protein
MVPYTNNYRGHKRMYCEPHIDIDEKTLKICHFWYQIRSHVTVHQNPSHSSKHKPESLYRPMEIKTDLLKKQVNGNYT